MIYFIAQLIIICFQIFIKITLGLHLQKIDYGSNNDTFIWRLACSSSVFNESASKIHPFLETFRYKLLGNLSMPCSKFETLNGLFKELESQYSEVKLNDKCQKKDSNRLLSFYNKLREDAAIKNLNFLEDDYKNLCNDISDFINKNPKTCGTKGDMICVKGNCECASKEYIIQDGKCVKISPCKCDINNPNNLGFPSAYLDCERGAFCSRQKNLEIKQEFHCVCQKKFNQNGKCLYYEDSNSNMVTMPDLVVDGPEERQFNGVLNSDFLDLQQEVLDLIDVYGIHQAGKKCNVTEQLRIEEIVGNISFTKSKDPHYKLYEIITLHNKILMEDKCLKICSPSSLLTCIRGICSCPPNLSAWRMENDPPSCGQKFGHSCGVESWISTYGREYPIPCVGKCYLFGFHNESICLPVIEFNFPKI